MRTSGNERDLFVVVVPLLVLVFTGLALAGGTGSVLSRVESQLWDVAQHVGAWVAALFS